MPVSQHFRNDKMTGKILFLAAVAAVCDAGLIPISNSWPSQTACTRTSSSGLGFVPNSGSLDYNQLLHVLYPEVTPEPLEDLSLSLINSYSQLGTGYEMNDLYKTLSPGIRGSSRLILPSREIGYSPFRGSGRTISYDDCRSGEMRNCGDCRGCDECRNCGEMRGNCECREFGEERGCCEERCMNDCRGYCKCRNCCQQRSNCECRGCGNQRNMECKNCCDSGECYSDCGCMGCSKPMSCSRSGSNYNRCGSSGCSSQRNVQCSPCRSMKMNGQCCSSSMCC